MSFLCALSNVIGAGVEDVAAEVADGGGEVGAALRNHVEVALPLGLDYLKYLHVEPQQQIHVGHDADAEAAGDEAGDDLVLGRLIRYFRLRADALEELVLDGAHTGAGGEEYVRIGQRVGEVDAVPLSERMAARDDKDNVLVRDSDGVKRGKIRRFRGENEVELPFQEPAEQAAREAGAGGEGEAYVPPGVLLEKAARQRGYELHAQRAQEAQAYEPLAARLAPQHVHAGVEDRERALGSFEEFLAEARERRIAPRALKKRQAELGFELIHGVAEARLSDAELLRGARVVPRMGQLYEISEVEEVHAVAAFRPYSTTKHR